MSQDTQYTLAFQDASTILLLPQTQPGCWEWGEGESGGDGGTWGRRFSCGVHVCLVVKTTLCVGIIVITPPSRLGGGVKMPMFDPQPGDTLEDRGSVRWTMRSGIDWVLASRSRMVGGGGGAARGR